MQSAKCKMQNGVEDCAKTPREILEHFLLRLWRSALAEQWQPD